MTPLDLGAPIPFATLLAIRDALRVPEPDAPQVARAHGVTLAVVRWAAQGMGVVLGGVALRDGEPHTRRAPYVVNAGWAA